MKPLLLIALLGLSNFSYGQLTDGTSAPDFTLTDINGQTFNLYDDAISQGKYVFIDFFATWCPPCWSDYQAGVTQYVEQNFGPNAPCGDQIVTLAIEADLQTTMADVLGTGNNTLGDWTGNNSYRVFNPTSGEMIADYMVNEYPTYYFICPNGLIYQQPFFDLGGITVSCLDCQLTNDVELLTISDSDCSGLTYTPEFGIQNINLPSLQSVQVFYSLDGGAENVYDWNGNIGLGGSGLCTLPAMSASEGTHSLKVRLELPNGVTDNNPLNSCKNYSITNMGSFQFNNFMEEFNGPELPEDDWLIVNFMDDLEWRFSSVNGGCMVMPGWEYFETIDYDIYAWTYLIGLNNVETPYFTMDYAYSNFPGGSNDDGIRVEIVSSCMEQTIFNESGAGLSTAPSIQTEFIPTSDQWETFCYDLSDFAGQNINIRIYGDYEFGNNVYLDNIGIVTNNCFVSLNELHSASEISLFPNPVDDHLQLKSILLQQDDALIRILDAKGQVVYTIEHVVPTNGSIELDTAKWPNGIYMAQINTQATAQTVKFIIARD